jgi:two-component system, NarL family, sensor kinase
VKLSLLPEPDKVVLQIADNGRGFDVSDGSPDGHLGLQLIRDTVAEAGGSLDIRSVPGEGTCVTTSLAR